MMRKTVCGKYEVNSVSLIAALITRFVEDFSLIEEDRSLPHFIKLRLDNSKWWEKEKDGDEEPDIRISIRIPSLTEPPEITIDLDLPEGVSRRGGVRARSVYGKVRREIAKYIPSLLVYDEDDYEILCANKLQLQSINRLVLRWKARPKNILRSGDTILVEYGNLVHQIELDGHCHT